MAKQTGKKKPVWVWVALLVAAAIVAGVGLWAVLTYVVAKDVVVPNVVGAPAAAARELLVDKGLKVAETKAFDATAPAGSVVSQDPKAGATVRTGTTVNLVISKGTDIVKVPDVVEMTRRDAIAALEKAGLKVGDVVERYDASVEEDVVIRQDPQAGEELPAGEAVDLFVSKGTRTTSVPNVVGKTQAAAREALTGAGLYAKVVKAASTQVDAGVVMSQQPLAQNRVPVNTTVTITVSSGPARVTVPGVVGNKPENARAKLEALGLVVQIEEVPDPSTKVVKQVPSAGSVVRKGSTVRLLVGDGSGAP